MSVERELRDAAELLEARIAALKEELSRHPAPAGSVGSRERRGALQTARRQLERRRAELLAQLEREAQALEEQRAAHEARFGWQATKNDSTATQDETTGAALGCASVVLPLLVANALLRSEEPWLRTAVVLGVLATSLVVAARQGFRAGRGLKRVAAEAARGE